VCDKSGWGPGDVGGGGVSLGGPSVGEASDCGIDGVPITDTWVLVVGWASLCVETVGGMGVVVCGEVVVVVGAVGGVVLGDGWVVPCVDVVGVGIRLWFVAVG